MARYFLKRLGMMLVALFLIILLTFVIMHAVPGGPFTSDRSVSEEVAAALNAKYNLDDYTLTNSYPIGISNEFVGTPVEIFVTDGSVLLVITQKD